jgi:GTP cyclohydrolase FolE2
VWISASTTINQSTCANLNLYDIRACEWLAGHEIQPIVALDVELLNSRHGIHMSRGANGNNVRMVVEHLVRHWIVILTFSVLVECQARQALERHGLASDRIDLVFA